MKDLRRCCAISFAIPFLGMLAVMVFYRCVPFGQNTFLYCDMYHQYFPFFAAFRPILGQSDSLIYNWSMGLGTDQLAMTAYYLASPLNLISVFLPESALLGYFSLLIPIKLGLAGCFFCVFLCKSFPYGKVSVCLFSSAYALCAWALGYQWNIMWLDSFALLPLVVLGMGQLLQKNKCRLFTVSLFLTVTANYYIGYFICVFLALLFLCHCICNIRSAPILRQFGRMALYSALALGMSAFLTLPAIYALKNTQGIQGTFPSLDSHAFETMLQVVGNTAGATPPTYLKGLPNIACTTAALFFTFVYLLDKNTCRIRRLCGAGIMLLLLLSFLWNPLDYIWHGFHQPNMIPHRYSFLFSFALLTMGYQGFLAAKQMSPKRLILAALGCGILFLGNSHAILLYNGILLAAYTVCAIHHRKMVSGICIAGLLVTELSVAIVGFAMTYPGKGVQISSYPVEKTNTQALLSYIKQDRTDFFRAETSYAQTLNDSALLGYPGISYFSSTANVSLTRLLRTMGLAAREGCNRYSYELGSPITNLFFSLKYVIHRQPEAAQCTGLSPVARTGKVTLLENSAWLPLGFLAQTALEDFDFFAYNDPFATENALLKAAAGVTEDAYTPAEEENLGAIRCFSITQEGLFCIWLGSCPEGVFSFYRNGKPLFSQRYSLPQVLSICQVSAADVMEVRIAADKADSVPILGAVLQEQVFWQAYDALSQSVMDAEFLSATQLTANISCPRNGLLYTSIPQDGNWEVTVDGVAVTPVLIGDVLLGIPLTQGDHTLHFSYHNKSFSLGCFLSLGALGIFLTLCIYKRKKAFP